MNHAPTEEELRNELESAPVVPIKGGADDSPDPSTPGGGVPHGGEAGNRNRGPGSGRPRGEIWDGCPVKPLGVRGEVSYFLDVHGQLRGLKKLGAQEMMFLFGHMIHQLCYQFPQWKKDDVTGEMERKPGYFTHQLATVAMLEAAGECGLFNPENAVRGVGAWQDDDGNLVYHLGNRMIVGGEEGPPRRIGRHIYPAYPPIPAPSDEPGPDPVPDILEALATWKWTRPDEHPVLALGMLCVQMMGGALDWRPTFWISAPAGSGKSWLNDLFKHLHGAEGLVQSTDATKSGITSKLGHASLPVALDEVEPGDERSTKERDLVTLARVASSGGEWARGSSDQTGVGGKVFSAFTFSSIIIPGIMKPQDLQRLIRLELEVRPPGWPKATLTPKTWRARGARLKRRLIDRWPLWREHLDAWRETLAQHGVAGRDADNWATVVAIAHLAMSSEIAEQAVRVSWAKKIAWMVADARPETNNDAEAMLLHLLGRTFDIYRGGEQHSFAQWIAAAANLPGAPAAILGRDTPGDATGDGTIERLKRAELANKRLAKAGLRVSPVGQGMEAQLFITNARNQWLDQVFAGTDWAGGAWSQSARRVPGATVPPHPLSLATIRQRGTQMPLRSIPALAEFPADKDDEPAASGGYESDVNGFA